MDEPLDNVRARDLVRRILSEGTVRFSQHAVEEMENDELTEVDCKNVMRTGLVEGFDLQHGSYRYRVAVPRVRVVVAFRSETSLVVVTAWKEKP